MENLLEKIQASLKPMMDGKKKKFLPAKSDEELLVEFLTSYRKTEKELFKLGGGIYAYTVLIQKLSAIDGGVKDKIICAFIKRLKKTRDIRNKIVNGHLLGRDSFIDLIPFINQVSKWINTNSSCIVELFKS